jgi:hypothetical protein
MISGGFFNERTDAEPQTPQLMGRGLKMMLMMELVGGGGYGRTSRRRRSSAAAVQTTEKTMKC